MVEAVAGVAPEPKFHEQDVIEPDDAFVNVVGCPIQIVRLLAVKSAVGAETDINDEKIAIINSRYLLADNDGEWLK